MTEVLSTALPLAAGRLYDDVDDVSAVAAAALVPVADDIARVMAHQLPDLVAKLWSLLAHQVCIVGSRAVLRSLQSLTQGLSGPLRPTSRVQQFTHTYIVPTS